MDILGLLKLILAFFKHESSAPITPVPPAGPYEPPWYTLAKHEVGFKERLGNRDIQRYTGPAKCGQEGDPWCAVFVNAMLEGVGIRGTYSAMARSFEHSAAFKRLDRPALGCIVTMWRDSPDSGRGHVFFYAGENDNGIVALGGNQKNSVCFQYEPKNRVFGYYWPAALPSPNLGPIYVAALAALTAGSEE